MMAHFDEIQSDGSVAHVVAYWLDSIGWTVISRDIGATEQ